MIGQQHRRKCALVYKGGAVYFRELPADIPADIPPDIPGTYVALV